MFTRIKDGRGSVANIVDQVSFPCVPIGVHLEHSAVTDQLTKLAFLVALATKILHTIDETSIDSIVTAAEYK